MLKHETSDISQFLFCESSVFRKDNRNEPEFGDLPITGYMDMGWFTSIRTKENKTVGTLPENRWHKDPSFMEVAPQFPPNS